MIKWGTKDYGNCKIIPLDSVLNDNVQWFGFIFWFLKCFLHSIRGVFYLLYNFSIKKFINSKIINHSRWPPNALKNTFIRQPTITYQNVCKGIIFEWISLTSFPMKFARNHVEIFLMFYLLMRLRCVGRNFKFDWNECYGNIITCFSTYLII